MKYLYSLLLSIALLLTSSTPASAAPLPEGTPALLSFGLGSTNSLSVSRIGNPDGSGCLTNDIKVQNSHDLSYVFKGPNNNEYTTNDFFRPDHRSPFLLQDGTFGPYNPFAYRTVAICPDASWPIGFYWLRRVELVGDNPVSPYTTASYGRYSGKAVFEPNHLVGNHGLNLGKIDFTLR